MIGNLLIRANSHTHENFRRCSWFLIVGWISLLIFILFMSSIWLLDLLFRFSFWISCSSQDYSLWSIQNLPSLEFLLSWCFRLSCIDQIFAFRNQELENSNEWWIFSLQHFFYYFNSIVCAIRFPNIFKHQVIEYLAFVVFPVTQHYMTSRISGNTFFITLATCDFQFIPHVRYGAFIRFICVLSSSWVLRFWFRFLSFLFLFFFIFFLFFPYFSIHFLLVAPIHSLTFVWLEFKRFLHHIFI